MGVLIFILTMMYQSGFIPIVVTVGIFIYGSVIVFLCLTFKSKK